MLHVFRMERDRAVSDFPEIILYGHVHVAAQAGLLSWYVQIQQFSFQLLILSAPWRHRIGAYAPHIIIYLKNPQTVFAWRIRQSVLLFWVKFTAQPSKS